ncbi:MAG: hypothetical protein KKE11_04935 [Gammaproteobacteria bacterium]|nr:hypothetical protein [Gammaproteobacteria bacterium]
MGIFSNKQSNLKEIWISSLRLYHKAFSQIWYLGVLAGMLTTISILLNVLYRDKGISLKILSFGSPLLISLVTVYLTSLILFNANNINNNQIVSLKNSLAYINKRFIKVVISVFILYFLYSFGLIAFILPGIFLFILFSMVQPLTLLDSNGIIESFKNSHKIVWGNWWRTFAILMPLMFINYWTGILLSYAFNNHRWYLIGIIGPLAILFYPLFYVCILVVFNDLKSRKTTNPIE